MTLRKRGRENSLGEIGAMVPKKLRKMGLKVSNAMRRSIIIQGICWIK